MCYSQDTSFMTHETAIGKTAHVFSERPSAPPEEELKDRQQDNGTQ
jgi:hypothetical protein